MSEQVRTMFASIAPRYDITNTILSLGIHHLWRKKAVRISGASNGMRVLDCATGTGDLAIEFKKAVGKDGYVLGTDFCAEMMDTAPAKASKQQLVIQFEVADATALPYEDNSFDIASISFGIRNVDDPVRCLEELSRVVKPNGTVVVIEFGQPIGFFGKLYEFHSRYIIPFLGGLLTGNKQAYQYLPKTAAAFPAGATFIEMMKKTKQFHSEQAIPLTGSIAYIYIGKVQSS
jgi:demethylmenaquinone methyltransferase/2-methoxy-6-polyprenyl-1,4-benzoquinol methylase